MNGKLIVIEGIDGSGKGTQAELLIKSLSQLTHVQYFDYPRYETSVFGALLGRCLKGEYGDFLALSPYISSLPYMLDRASAANDMRAALQEGYVVCNRYTTSSLAHQTAKAAPNERKKVAKFIETGEYDELGIPNPDFVIFLNVPNKHADELVKKKVARDYLGRSGHDLSEQDRHHQATAEEMYLELAKTRPEWHIVDCTEDGTLLSPEAIHRKVLDIVLPKVDSILLQCMVKHEDFRV